MITPLAAAELVRLDYREPETLDTLARMEIDSVQSRIVRVPPSTESMVEAKTVAELPPALHALIVTGSNERRDWAYNLFYVPTTPASGDRRTWHRGFYNHSKPVYGLASGWLAHGGTIDLVCGHSLGAAAAQVVGSSLGITTYCFEAPKPLISRRQPPGAQHVTCYNRDDDLICKLPPLLKHVGEVVWLKPQERHRGFDHSIELCIEAMRENGVT